MTGPRGGNRGGFRGRGRREPRVDIYSGEHAEDFPSAVGLIEVINDLRQPRHRYNFDDETMILKFQEMTLTVHGCADHAEGKRVASDLMLKQVYPEHKLNPTSASFKDAHEIKRDAEAWNEDMEKYNENRRNKRLEFLEDMKNNTSLTEEARQLKIESYEQNYKVREIPQYGELCQNYMARKQKNKDRVQKKRENRNSRRRDKERMSSGESTPGSKSSDDKKHDSDVNEYEEDPDKKAYNRVVEMLADVCRVQNMPYPVYDFDTDESQAMLTMTFETTVIKMSKPKDVRLNMRGIISDLMLKRLYSDHQLMPVTLENESNCNVEKSTENWEEKVAACRDDNRTRVEEKMKLLDERKDRMDEATVAEMRARYELWLEERPQPTYAELCQRVDDRLARIAARRGKRSYRPDRAGGDQGSGRRNKRGSGGQRRTGGRGPFRGRKRMPRRRGNKNGEVDTAAAGDGAQKTELAVE